MNKFGEFLYQLRKNKGLTQAQLAEQLGVTNKAVSKWETGEAMPEASLILPLADILGVTADELLTGGRTQKDANVAEPDEIKSHLFTRGKDDNDNKTLPEKICGIVCFSVIALSTLAYIFIGVFTSIWHPTWLIISVGALSCGIIGILFDLCNPVKRNAKKAKGENPIIGSIAGLVILSCIISYMCAGTFTGLWHPLWVIIVAGALVCGLLCAIAELIKK